MALGLFALTETTSCTLAGLAHTLGILGAEPIGSIVRSSPGYWFDRRVEPLRTTSVRLMISGGRSSEASSTHGCWPAAHPAVANGKYEPRGLKSRRPRPQGPSRPSPQSRTDMEADPRRLQGARQARSEAEPLRQKPSPCTSYKLRP